MRRSNRRALALLAVVFAASSTLALPGASPAQQRAVRLDPVSIAPGVESFGAVGEDPRAPRALVLWRLEAGVFRRLARVSSTADGRFDFGEQPRPLGVGSFHVLPVGEAPEGSPGRTIARSLPCPLVLSSGLDPNEIELAPALWQGVIEVRDAQSGRLLLTRILSAESAERRSPARIDFAAEGVATHSERVTLEHVLPDGRRSEAIHWSLVPAD